MNIRPKTMRRLAVLFAGLLLLCLILGGLWLRSEREAEQRLMEERQAGMNAYVAEDYATALQHLSRYFSKSQDKRQSDVEGLFAYGKSRSRVEEINSRHVLEAIGVFRELLKIDPKHAEAQHLLLELYTKANYNAETEKLADEILSQNPNDLAAMKSKTLSLTRLGKFEQALEVSLKHNELAPMDLEGQLLTLELLWRLKRPGQELLDRAEQLRKQYPDDPRFELLLASAYGRTNDEESARTWLRTAASRQAPDAEFVIYLSRLFDRLGLFEESLAVVNRASADPKIAHILVQRLWQGGQYKDVVERLKDLDPASPGTDGRLLGFKALAHYYLKQPEQAKPIVEALVARSGDPAGNAWGKALRARFPADDRANVKVSIELYQDALIRDPENAVVRFFLGEAYAQLGETELALQEWQRAADLAPSWALPHIMKARVLTSTGRTQAAWNEAWEAYQRAPNQVSTASALAVAWFSRIEETGDMNETKKLLNFVANLQKNIPNEPESLPIYATLLARTGQRDAAVQVINAALKAEPPHSQETLLRLASVSSDEKLSVERAIFERAESSHGVSPALGYARAAEMAGAGKPQDGLAYLQDAAVKSAADPLQWQLSIARYKELIKDPGVAAEWAKLAEQNPEDLRVQKIVLEAPSAWRDRELIAKTFERVRQLTGEEGVDWRMAKARWLLSGGEASEAVVILNEIVRTSPNLTRPRTLLARALQATGGNNNARAIDELKAAVELNPSAADVTIELVQLLQTEKKFDEARRYLDRLVSNPQLTEESRRQVASMLVQQGELVAATTLLEQLAGQETPEPITQAMLAELYHRQGRSNDAEALYRKLLGQTDLTASIVQSAAEFFAWRNDMDQARKVLARLDDIQLRPGVKDLVLATFEERHVGQEQALQRFVAATKAASDNPDTWRHLVGFHMRHARFPEALAAANQGLAVLPDSKELQLLKVQAEMLGSGPDHSDLQPLIDALAADPSSVPAQEALRIINDARKGNEPAPQTVEKLQQLSDRHPRFLPLQNLLVQGYLSINQLDRAAQVAQRAMLAFPNDPEPAKLAVTVYAAAQSWRDMQVAAQKWRERSLDQPLPADIVIAEAYLQMNQPSSAISQLSSYVEQAKAHPNENVALLGTYARALILSGRSKEASQLLLPLAKQSPTWRAAWLMMLTAAHTNADAAISWVNEVAPLVPAAAPDEQLVLANAWNNIAQKFNNKAALDLAFNAVAPLAAKPDASADVILLHASVAEQLGKLDVAEAGYRKGLQMQPDQPIAQNNLAFLLVQQSKNLDEAKRLSSQAVETVPGSASFRDTLARVHARSGNRSEALASFDAALKLDPNYLDAMIGKAEVLSQEGQWSEVGRLLDQIDVLLKNAPPLSSPVKQQLQSIRDAAKSNLAGAQG